MLALGVLASDLLYVVGTYLGVHFLTQIPSIEKYLGLTGGVILIGFGISFMVKKVPSIAEELLQGHPKKRKAFFQGFGINGINPFVMLFWLSIASMVSVKPLWGLGEMTLFYGSVLVTIFGIDLLKAFLAGRLRPFLSPKLKKGMQIFAGILICYFGLKMLWDSFYHLF